MADEIREEALAGLDASEREIADREIREGRLRVVIPVVVDKDVKVGTAELRDANGAVKVTIANLNWSPTTAEEHRDLRDPSTVGERLLQVRRELPDQPFSRIADYVDKETL